MKRYRHLLVLLSLFALPALSAAERILVLGAVPQEIVPLVEALTDHTRETVEGIPCDLGRIGGHEVVIALTGIGKTNSALTTTALLLHYRPAKAFMTGTAARIRASVRTGDVLVVETVTFHDAGSLTRDGMIQGSLAKDGTMARPTWWSPARDQMNPFTFHSTPELVRYAEDVATRYKPEAVTANDATYTPIVRKGSVVTGDLSGVTEAKIADIRAKHDPDLMEMESAAFAQVCAFFEIPHLIIRSGSNVAQERNTDDYLRLSPIAARQAALFTAELVRELPKG
jgi:adenosylhomocysteine nucleosidase